MGNAIIVEGLGKKFRRFHPERPSTLQEAFFRGLRSMGPVEFFWALRDVSFNVAPGRMVGVIGPNGAGKSTLLRLIGSVGKPDEGMVEVHGRIGALLDLGAGFHPDLTGRENVSVTGVITGLTRRELSKRFDSIVAFAELEEFIDSPLRTYSTGMRMRLAFAIAVHVEPEILVIDEVLAVGDLLFKSKCLERIAQFKANGCTILLVSHDTALIRGLCDEALWLRSGHLMAHGPAHLVVDQYHAEVGAETRRRTPAMGPTVHTARGTELRVNENRFGSLELEVTSVRLLNPQGFPAAEIESGEPLSIEIDYMAVNPIPAPIFGVIITREDDLICYDTTTTASGLIMPTIKGYGQVVLHLERLDLKGGLYYVDVGVYERDCNYAYDYHWHVYPLIIRSDGRDKGVLRTPHRWEIGGKQKLQAAMPIRRAP